MEVVLIQNVPKLGHAYDVVKVKPGFARNYLLPQGKAALITPALLKRAEKIRGERVKKLEELVAQARDLALKLKDVTLTFKKKVRGEKLYGSISVKEIMEALKETAKLEVTKDVVKIVQPIKTLGEHWVMLHLAEGVEAKVKVMVEEEK